MTAFLLSQRGELAALIASHGGEVHVVDGPLLASNAGLPLSDKRFLLPRMRQPNRRNEAALWTPFVQALGYSVLPPPEDYFEGQCEVASFTGRAIVSYGPRSSRAGAEEAARLLGDDSVVVEIREPALHGNTAVLPLARANRLLLCPDVFSAASLALLDASFPAERFLRINIDELRAQAASSLVIGDTIIASSALPERLRTTFGKIGYRVATVAIDSPRSLVCEL